MTKTLVIVHAGLASATQTPEMKIDDEEGALLANAAANVMQQFNIAPDPKVQAIVGLVMACGTVYGPRVYLIRERQRAEKASRTADPITGEGVATVYNGEGGFEGSTGFKVDPPKPFGGEKLN